MCRLLAHCSQPLVCLLGSRRMWQWKYQMRCWFRQWRRLNLTLNCEDNENTNCGPKVTGLFKNVFCVKLVLLISSVVWSVWLIFWMRTLWSLVHILFSFYILCLNPPESFNDCTAEIHHNQIFPPKHSNLQHITTVTSKQVTTAVVLSMLTPTQNRNCVSVLSFHVSAGTVFPHPSQSVPFDNALLN
jgi:hypothetical protein